MSPCRGPDPDLEPAAAELAAAAVQIQGIQSRQNQIVSLLNCRTMCGVGGRVASVCFLVMDCFSANSRHRPHSHSSDDSSRMFSVRTSDLRQRCDSHKLDCSPSGRWAAQACVHGQPQSTLHRTPVRKLCFALFLFSLSSDLTRASTEM